MTPIRKLKVETVKPEFVVRKHLNDKGFRYECNVTKLPYTPDLAFPDQRCVVFVKGCFWHGHPHKELPLARREFWRRKIAAHQRRVREATAELVGEGWTVLTVWECDLKRFQEKTLLALEMSINHRVGIRPIEFVGTIRARGTAH